MTEQEQFEYMFLKTFTDEDWESETDPDRLIYMAINWSKINGKWNNVSQEKIDALIKNTELTKSQKIQLSQMGFYKLNEDETAEMQDDLEIIKGFEDFMDEELGNI